ncbi:hypothetical protein H6P81_003305 [Aristolochia fimbriata]|uniref:Aminotransferase-like plant mobile domain-containing protein n=1 Tax=Aristolochia fimbriata TaxID=158543 RepID=A0AAV7FC65_ARIFI|nr:hypothetical protein H6P81_003305 [Aristolochia fimbriata]
MKRGWRKNGAEEKKGETRSSEWEERGRALMLPGFFVNKGVGSCGLTKHCSPFYFLKRLKDIGLKERHTEAVRNTSFGHFVNLQDGHVEATLVTTLARHYNPRRKSFLIGREHKVFSVKEVSNIMSLSLVGDEVDLSQSCSGSDLVAKYFKNKLPERKEIVEKLKILVRVNKDIKGITKPVVLFIFVCILFPQTNYYLPQSLYKYIDDIEGLRKYAWGVVVYNYVVDQLVKKKDDPRGYFGGCALDVTAWYYKIIEELGHELSMDWAPGLVFTGLLVYLALVSIGMGVVPWVIIAEV